MIGLQILASVVSAASHKAATMASLNQDLKDVASFASLTLAMLTFLTAGRTQKLAADLTAGIGSLGFHEAGQGLVDAALAILTLSACVALWPLFSASWSPSHWTQRQHLLESMFCIVYIGFVWVFLLQTGLFLTRLITAATNGFSFKIGGSAPAGTG